LALDRRGKAWFLEANMRQQRWAPSALHNQRRAFVRQYLTPMAHAAYLLGLTGRKSAEEAGPGEAAAAAGGEPEDRAGNGGSTGSGPVWREVALEWPAG